MGIQNGLGIFNSGNVSDGSGGGGGGSGTVTTVSVVSANGLAGTVANPTTTPTITLETTIEAPILAGKTNAIIAASTTGTGQTAVLSEGPDITSPNIITSAVFPGATSGSVTVQAAAAAGTGTIFQLPANNGTNGYVIKTDGAGALSYAPDQTGLTAYDAIIDGVGTAAFHYTTFNDAYAAGASNMLMTASTSLTASLQFNRVITLTLNPNVVFSGLTFQIDHFGYDFVVYGTGTSSNISYAQTATNTPMFIDTRTFGPLSNLVTNSVKFDWSQVTGAGSCIHSTDIAAQYYGFTVTIAGNVDGAGETSSKYNTFYENLVVATAAGGSSNIFNFGIGRIGSLLIDLSSGASTTLPVFTCAQGTGISIMKLRAVVGGSVAPLLSVGGVIDTMIVDTNINPKITITASNAAIENTNINDGLIISAGGISNVQLLGIVGTASSSIANNSGDSAWSLFGCNILGSTTMSGTDIKLNGSNFNSLTLASGTNIVNIVGCTATSYTNSGATNVHRAGNDNVIGNDAGIGAGFSPYNVQVAAGNTYTTVAPAVAANLNKPLVTGTVVETGNVVISGATPDNLTALIDSNSTWDLSTHSVQLTGGVTAANVQIELLDSTAKWNYSSNPFTSFNSPSVFNFIGNGGIINNNSTTGGNPINVGAGLVVMDNFQMNLPNATNGGIHTNSTSNIQRAIFTGGGTNCDTAIRMDGGEYSNITFNGTYATNAALNLLLGTTKSAMSNIIVNTASNTVLNINGIASNIQNIGSGTLTLQMNTNSELSAVSANGNEIVSLGTGITNVTMDTARINSFNFATDNSNSYVTIYNANFINAISIYGTVIKFTNCSFQVSPAVENGSSANFDNCNFVQTVITETGSTASFVNCTAGTAPTFNGTVIRAGNNTTLGNDYGSSAITGSSISLTNSAGTVIETLTQTSGASKTSLINTVNTTDATVTTIQTITLPTDTTYGIRGFVEGRRTGGASGSTGDSAVYTFFAAVKNIGGTASLISTADIVAKEDQPAWDLTIDATGATIRIRVTGAASNNITWNVLLEQFGM